MTITSSYEVPAGFWFQGFRDGASFGQAVPKRGVLNDPDHGDLELDLKPIGPYKLNGSEGMTLSLPIDDPPYIQLGDKSLEFDKHWEAACLVISSKDINKIILLPTCAMEEGNLITLGHACHYETGKVQRDIRASIGDHEALHTAYHDVTYTVQFVRRVGPTFIPGSSSKFKPFSPHQSPTHGNDVALVFPHESFSSPVVLWSCKKVLMQLSTYYEAMFTGGYLENENVLTGMSNMLEQSNLELARIAKAGRDKCRSKCSASSDSDESEAEGSDHTDEDPDTPAPATGAGMVNESAEESLHSTTAFTMHYVTINHAYYKTYKALLHWVETGEIQFSRLKSSAMYTPNPYASPKSIYKLAHHLGIEKLQKIAVNNFESQLSPSIVLKELFSPTCFAHLALREAAYNALEKQWEEVKNCGGLDDLLSLIQADNADLKEMMLVAVEILKRADRLGKEREDS